MSSKNKGSRHRSVVSPLLQGNNDPDNVEHPPQHQSSAGELPSIASASATTTDTSNAALLSQSVVVLGPHTRLDGVPPHFAAATGHPNRNGKHQQRRGDDNDTDDDADESSTYADDVEARRRQKLLQELLETQEQQLLRSLTSASAGEDGEEVGAGGSLSSSAAMMMAADGSDGVKRRQQFEHGPLTIYKGGGLRRVMQHAESHGDKADVDDNAPPPRSSHHPHRGVVARCPTCLRRYSARHSSSSSSSSSSSDDDKLHNYRHRRKSSSSSRRRRSSTTHPRQHRSESEGADADDDNHLNKSYYSASIRNLRIAKERELMAQRNKHYHVDSSSSSYEDEEDNADDSVHHHRRGIEYRRQIGGKRSRSDGGGAEAKGQLALVPRHSDNRKQQKDGALTRAPTGSISPTVLYFRHMLLNYLQQRRRKRIAGPPETEKDAAATSSRTRSIGVQTADLDDTKVATADNDKGANSTALVTVAAPSEKALVASPVKPSPPPPLPENPYRKLAMNGYYHTNFQEIKRIGAGTFGGVFLCRHVVGGEDMGIFAVKKIAIGDDNNYLRQVLREVRVLEEVRKHPNVVEYYHSWIDYGKPSDFGPWVRCLFILQEFATEGSLDTYLESKTRVIHTLNDLAVWYFFLSAVAGVAHLHSRGMLHRDLKPQNLLLTKAMGGAGGLTNESAGLVDPSQLEADSDDEEKANKAHEAAESALGGGGDQERSGQGAGEEAAEDVNDIKAQVLKRRREMEAQRRKEEEAAAEAAMTPEQREQKERERRRKASANAKPPRVLVADFGTAALLSEVAADVVERTGATGTLEYMAPELFVEDNAANENTNDNDPTSAAANSSAKQQQQQQHRAHYKYRHTMASDVWGLGMILHYLAFGGALPTVELRRPPQQGTAGGANDDEPSSPTGTRGGGGGGLSSTHRVRLPANYRRYNRSPEIIELIKMMLSLDPAKRPSCLAIMKSPFVQKLLRQFEEWERNHARREREERRRAENAADGGGGGGFSDGLSSPVNPSSPTSAVGLVLGGNTTNAAAGGPLSSAASSASPTGGATSRTQSVSKFGEWGSPPTITAAPSASAKAFPSSASSLALLPTAADGAVPQKEDSPAPNNDEASTTTNTAAESEEACMVASLRGGGIGNRRTAAAAQRQQSPTPAPHSPLKIEGRPSASTEGFPIVSSVGGGKPSAEHIQRSRNDCEDDDDGAEGESGSDAQQQEKVFSPTIRVPTLFPTTTTTNTAAAHGEYRNHSLVASPMLTDPAVAFCGPANPPKKVSDALPSTNTADIAAPPPFPPKRTLNNPHAVILRAPSSSNAGSLRYRNTESEIHSAFLNDTYYKLADTEDSAIADAAAVVVSDDEEDDHDAMLEVTVTRKDDRNATAPTTDDKTHMIRDALRQPSRQKEGKKSDGSDGNAACPASTVWELDDDHDEDDDNARSDNAKKASGGVDNANDNDDDNAGDDDGASSSSPLYRDASLSAAEAMEAQRQAATEKGKKERKQLRPVPSKLLLTWGAEEEEAERIRHMLLLNAKNPHHNHNQLVVVPSANAANSSNALAQHHQDPSSHHAAANNHSITSMNNSGNGSSSSPHDDTLVMSVGAGGGGGIRSGKKHRPPVDKRGDRRQQNPSTTSAEGGGVIASSSDGDNDDVEGYDDYRKSEDGTTTDFYESSPTAGSFLRMRASDANRLHQRLLLTYTGKAATTNGAAIEDKSKKSNRANIGASPSPTLPQQGSETSDHHQASNKNQQPASATATTTPTPAEAGNASTSWQNFFTNGTISVRRAMAAAVLVWGVGAYTGRMLGGGNSQ